jgi:hypothetical protein
MKVYLVTGASGSYSDRSEWPVKAFTNERKASNYAASLPGIYAELCKPTEEDRVEAEKRYNEYVSRYDIPGRDYKELRESLPHSVARDRAYVDMCKMHDPNFSPCGEIRWAVMDLELEEEEEEDNDQEEQ